MGDEQVLNEHQVALLIGVTVHTLRAWRWRKTGGPPYLKLSSCVRYRLSDVKVYLDKHLVDSEGKPKIQPGRSRAESCIAPSSKWLTGRNLRPEEMQCHPKSLENSSG